MNFAKADKFVGQTSTTPNLQQEYQLNQYLCFYDKCPYSDTTNLSKPRKCHLEHPMYVLQKQQIATQQPFFSHFQGQYDMMMGVLYQAVSFIQELQKIIQVFNYFPQLKDDSIEYQQNLFNKLKNHFELIQNQDKYLLVVKNQSQLFFQFERFLGQIKEQIFKFDYQCFNFRKMVSHQRFFLELSSESFIKNQMINNFQQKLFNISRRDQFIVIEDLNSSDNNDIQIIEQSVQKQQVIDEDNDSDKNQVIIEINSHNQPKDDQIVELSSGEDDIQFQVEDFKETFKFHNMMDQKIDQKKCQNSTNYFKNQQKSPQQTILQNNQNQNLGKTSSQYDEQKPNQTSQILNKKIQKQKKQLAKEADPSSDQQNKTQKQKRQRMTKEQKILLIQNLLKSKLDETKIPDSISENQTQKENQEVVQHVPQNIIKFSLNKIFDQQQNDSKQNSSEDTLKINISHETTNGNQQQQQDFLKATQLFSSISESLIPNEKVIEDDDELEQELQIVQRQNGSVEKLMVTQYSWSMKSNEKKKSFDSNEEENSKSSQINRQNNFVGKESDSEIMSKNENYFTSFKVVYFKKQKALLALNQKNIILYTFQKPKPRKQVQLDQYNIDSEEEQQESKSQQEVDYNFLCKKKILFSNIKSAEIFEIYGSYFVLVMFDTNGLVNVVKSNNLIKWKPYYKSVEPSVQANYYIFNTTLYMILFYSSQIKLVQLDVNSSKPNAKQVTSIFLQQSLQDGCFSTACQGIWSLKKELNQIVERKNDLYFTILQENSLLLFKYDQQKIQFIAKEFIQNILFCKILKLNYQLNIVAILENEIQLFNQQIKLHTRIQANPDFGAIIDVSLLTNQKENEQTLIILQQKGSFLYNLQKNKSNILRLSDKYNSIFYSQNLNSVITLNEQDNESFQLSLNIINQPQI